MKHLEEVNPQRPVARAWRRRGEGGAAIGDGLYFRVMQCFGTRQRSHSIVDVLNAPELFNLRWVILCCVKKISRGALAWGQELQGLCGWTGNTAPRPGPALRAPWKPTHVLLAPSPRWAPLPSPFYT